MRNHETGLDYAKFDHSETRIRQARHVHTPSWQGAYIYCLKVRDYESAELIKSKQMVSDECRNDGCEDCDFLWCTCPHHAAVQFELEHPQLRSLSEAHTDEEELEYV